jgi:hypothetical protein
MVKEIVPRARWRDGFAGLLEGIYTLLPTLEILYEF